MIVSGFLQNPEVRRWLNGVEPAWTMLEFNSLNALRHEPSASNHAMRLEPDLADAEISGSAVTANALILHDLATRPHANVDRASIPPRQKCGMRGESGCSSSAFEERCPERSNTKF